LSFDKTEKTTCPTLDFLAGSKTILYSEKVSSIYLSRLRRPRILEESKPAPTILNHFGRMAEPPTRVYLQAFTKSVSQGQVFNPKSEFHLS